MHLDYGEQHEMAVVIQELCDHLPDTFPDPAFTSYCQHFGKQYEILKWCVRCIFCNFNRYTPMFEVKCEFRILVLEKIFVLMYGVIILYEILFIFCVSW